MKKLVLLVVLTGLATFSVFSQSYIGYVTQAANLRHGPGTEYGVIMLLKEQSIIFISSIETQNDFYNVLDVDTDREGYIHKSLVQLIEQVMPNEISILNYGGKGDFKGKAKVEIFNNTYLMLSIKFNNETFSFNPKEKRTVTLESGSCSYRASAPGVIPAIGTERISGNSRYSWEFYLETTYR